MTHPEIEAEQSHIDRAHRLLEKARDRALKLRGMVEVSRGGTTQARYERDVIEGSIQNRLGQLQLGSASLIFGRIDLDNRDQFHIGRLAVADEEQEPVVVDWRAPIAEPFYRAATLLLRLTSYSSTECPTKISSPGRRRGLTTMHGAAHYAPRGRAC